MNLNLVWRQHGNAKPVDYFRAVSTGPATPLVLSATTVGEHLNLGITYRQTVFSPAAIEQIKTAFLTCINDLETHPCEPKPCAA
jgi:hypothetical protein